MKMKNKLKMVMCFMIGFILAGTIVYAAGGLTARNIGYSDDTAKAALDDLYKKADRQSIEIKKVCQYQSEGSFGAKGVVGAKYKCQLGSEDKDTNGVIYRYFYILAVNNDNTVDLIMDRNITQGTSYKTMTWMNAMDFFDNSNVAGGLGTSIKEKWVNVLDVDLPKAQDIANAVNNSSWKAETKNYDGWFCLGLKDQSSCAAGNWTYATEAGKTAVAPYKWLFNYTRDCAVFGCDSSTSLGSGEAYGYWTRDVVAQRDAGQAWDVGRYGFLFRNPVNNEGSGVRPVITLLKSNLYD